MALPKLFQRIFFHNNTTPAINEDNLNAISKAVDDIDNRVITLGDDVLEVVPQIQAYLEQAEDLVEALETLSTHPPYIGANGNWWVWNTSTEAFVDSGVDASITVDIADITMIAYGQTPYVTNTGTDTDPVFHLFLPAPSGINNIAKSGTSGLVDTYTITFDDGTTSTFFVTNGKSIVSITKTGTSGLVDTYTIAFNDNTTSTFTVTNGKGITGISKSSTSGLVDTYTISFNDGTSSSFDVTNGTDGVGIVSITKTGTSGLVDTYTITYTNGNTSTFTVTNGQDGAGGSIDALTDTNIDTQTLDTGDVLVYDATIGKWVNGQVDIASKMDKANPTGTGSFSLNRKSETTVGNNSFAEGYNTTASGYTSHAEGNSTTASSDSSHAEGYGTTASGADSHAEGDSTIANGSSSHAEGTSTRAYGTNSHAEGQGAIARGYASHAGGISGTAQRDKQFVQGGGSSKKFSSAGMPSSGYAMFGFQPDYTNYSSDTTITDGGCGCGGCISGTATVTIELEDAGMYLLVCASFTVSSGAGYGSTVRMITAIGTTTGTPVNLSLGQTSNAPATIGMAANEKITIKNSATTRVTEFHLIRIL